MKATKPARRAMKRKSGRAPARRVVVKHALVHAAKAGEYVRTVPLHYPKPTYALKDVVLRILRPRILIRSMESPTWRPQMLC